MNLNTRSLLAQRFTLVAGEQAAASPSNRLTGGVDAEPGSLRRDAAYRLSLSRHSCRYHDAFDLQRRYYLAPHVLLS